MRKNNLIILIIIFLSFSVGIYLYPQMPEKMVSHWNTEGQVDGYISKFWGLFLMPFISVALWLLFVLIPMIDPLKENIEKFRKYFDKFITIIILFLFYIYFLTVAWNRGFRFDLPQLLAPAFGVIFYYSGVLTENAKRNWFIGIRTPWTLSSEIVWEKTHKLGGKLFKASGVIAFLGVFFNDLAFFLVLVPVILVTIYAFVYSYLEYKKEKESAENEKQGSKV